MRLIELPGFDDAVRAVWHGTTLPAVYDGERVCPRCSHGTVIRLDPVVQDALFYHGGYGASERETVDVCLACHRVTVHMVETIRPPR